MPDHTWGRCHLVMKDVEIVSCFQDFGSKCFEGKCLVSTQASRYEVQLEDDHMIRDGTWLRMMSQPAPRSC